MAEISIVQVKTKHFPGWEISVTNHLGVEMDILCGHDDERYSILGENNLHIIKLKYEVKKILRVYEYCSWKTKDKYILKKMH